MSLKFGNLKRSKKTEKIKTKKIKVKTQEIKVNISNNSIIKNKFITHVYKFKSIEKIYNFLENISPNIRLKLLINYNEDKYYIFKTEINQKKEDLKENILEDYNDIQLDSNEIAKLLKTFYSEDPFEFSDSIKNLKNAIAPKEFTIENNYLRIENRYAKVISIEHVNNSCVFENILKDKNISSWLYIDCYKVDNQFILEKLNEMKSDNLLEKKFTNSIIAKIDDVTYKLQNEVIFQCEIKLLLYNRNLELLKSDSDLIINNLNENYCTAYVPQEKINVRKLFEKSIYPNLTMNIVHTIDSDSLIKMIGSEKNV